MYPRVLFSRTLQKDGSKYFGPFFSAAAVKETIDLVNKLFGLRTCSNGNFTKRACLNLHIEACCGPCVGRVTKEEYRSRINDAIAFLAGDRKKVKDDLVEKINKAVEEMKFEEAAGIRDLIASIDAVSEHQKITNYSLDDRDIVAVAKSDNTAVVWTFFVRDGKIVSKDYRYMTEAGGSEAEILCEFVKQFYSGTPFIPAEILLQHEIEDMDLIADYISSRRGSKVTIRAPKIGDKEKLIYLAARNARNILEKDKARLMIKTERGKEAMAELRELLDLPDISRIEAFDISNTNGFENVGSMVVFEDGDPKKSDYRKFRIKSVSGPNDYACMKEVLTRRFMHGLKDLEEDENINSGFARFPDLLLMDGGRGQVNIAKQVLDELHLDIPVAGMVKNDRHQTRGLYFNNVEIDINTRGPAFKMITNVQDEAHRFAITYHKNKRSKAQVHSILDDIPGIGPKRRLELMRNYASMEELKNATAEEISEKCGFPINISEEVLNYLKKPTNVV